MLESQVNKLLSLPEVKIVRKRNLCNNILEFEAYKFSDFEVCPKCAKPTSKVYDHVYVNIKDTPIRDKVLATCTTIRDIK